MQTKRIDEYKTPFNDNKLEYDKDRHMYLLNIDYATNTFGSKETSTFDEETWKIFQYNLSDNVYTFIYSFKNNSLQYDIMEYELAKNQYYREVIAEALLSQFEYAKATSGDVVNLQHGVNIGSDKTTSLDVLRGELLVATKTYLKLWSKGLLNATTVNDDFDYDNYRKDY